MTDNRTTKRVDHPPRVRGAIDELMREKDVIGNRTTELREKLTERGVKWRAKEEELELHLEGFYDTRWDANGVHWCYIEFASGNTCLTACNDWKGCTPEQAIAATLSRPTFDANLEQALSFMRIWISDDAHLGESELSAVFEKAEGLRKLDAIESAIAATLGDDDYEHRMDELLCRLTNGKWSKSRSYSVDFMVACVDESYEDAALGGGECECVWNEQDGTFRCSSCDTRLTNEISIEWPSHKVTPITLPNYCSNCGKAVKR